MGRPHGIRYRGNAVNRYVPAGALLHPLAIAALGLLVVNDHWWKDQFGSIWTGKLSDVAGLILFR